MSHKRKNLSEVLTSNTILNQEGYLNSDQIRNNNKISEVPNKEQDNTFLESFSEITKNIKNHLVEPLNINLEEISIEGGNNMNNFLKNIMGNNKTYNRGLIKTITQKFHELYLKLVQQIKLLKIENSQLKKNNENSKHHIGDFTSPENEDFNLENESDTVKYLMQEEIECFNQILYDFNNQFNEVQSQEESLRRDILKKHKEIEKVNIELEDFKKQKEVLVKELQNIAVRLGEYKVLTFQQNPFQNQIESNENTETNHEKYEEDNENYNIESEEFYLLINSDNQEYLIKKILHENKKYKSMIKKMKSDETEFSNYLMTLEAELENFAKYKNFCMTKVNKVDENVQRCQEKMDSLSEKINNIEMQLELEEDTTNFK